MDKFDIDNFDNLRDDFINYFGSAISFYSVADVDVARVELYCFI